MAKYRDNLPMLGDQIFLTDSGLETYLIFKKGLELPEFAAIDLLRTEEGCNIINDYYRLHADIARQNQMGFLLEGIGWRASSDWAPILGYSLEELKRLNRKSVDILLPIQKEYDSKNSPCVISFCIGPRGDGYRIGEEMNVQAAKTYHDFQVQIAANSEADLISALTIGYPSEAIGIALAAKHHAIPVVISYVVETDGSLPNGQNLQSAIEETDEATNGYPSYYMINCAHPSHFDHLFETTQPWHSRIVGLRANASMLSHEELDNMDNLDEGDSDDLALRYQNLRKLAPQIKVLGGCCGTDHNHIEAIAKSCL